MKASTSSIRVCSFSLTRGPYARRVPVVRDVRTRRFWAYRPSAGGAHLISINSESPALQTNFPTASFLTFTCRRWSAVGGLVSFV